MTLQELARIKGKTLSTIGVPPSTAFFASAGRTRPSGKTLAKMAKALGVTTEVVDQACAESCAHAAQRRASRAAGAQ